MALWGYEESLDGQVRTVAFDDQTSVLLESHRDKCNKAKSQDEVDFYSRVLVSDKVIVDVVECRAYVSVDGDMPTQAYLVFRNEVAERVLTAEKEK